MIPGAADPFYRTVGFDCTPGDVAEFDEVTCLTLIRSNIAEQVTNVPLRTGH